MFTAEEMVKVGNFIKGMDEATKANFRFDMVRGFQGVYLILEDSKGRTVIPLSEM